MFKAACPPSTTTRAFVDAGGGQPNDLPIEQPTKFELAVNLKSAKQIGLSIPEAFLARADALLERPRAIWHNPDMPGRSDDVCC